MSYINVNKRLSKLKDDLDEILSKEGIGLEDVFNNIEKRFCDREVKGEDMKEKEINKRV